MWVVHIKDFIVLLFVYTKIFYKCLFDATPYLINAVLKNSMVLNMKAYNLKHIYFSGLGRRLVLKNLLLFLVTWYTINYSIGGVKILGKQKFLVNSYVNQLTKKNQSIHQFPSINSYQFRRIVFPNFVCKRTWQQGAGRGSIFSHKTMLKALVKFLPGPRNPI